MDLHALTIHEAGEWLARGRTTSVALTEAVLARISAVDGRVHAYLRTEPEAALVTALQEISADIAWQTELAEHLVVISNEMFSYFAEHACEIAQHVKIVVETGVAQAGALFNQVNVPSETMFYSIMHCTVPEAADLLAAKLEENDQVLQIGADAGSGLGWCSVKLSSKGNN